MGGCALCHVSPAQVFEFRIWGGAVAPVRIARMKLGNRGQGKKKPVCHLGLILSKTVILSFLAKDDSVFSWSDGKSGFTPLAFLSVGEDSLAFLAFPYARAVLARRNDFSLSRPGEIGAWGHGCGLQSRRPQPPSVCCAEASPGRFGARLSDAGALSARGAGSLGVESSKHLHDPRHWGAGRPCLHRDGDARGSDVEREDLRGPT